MDIEIIKNQDRNSVGECDSIRIFLRKSGGVGEGEEINCMLVDDSNKKRQQKVQFYDINYKVRNCQGEGKMVWM